MSLLNNLTRTGLLIGAVLLPMSSYANIYAYVNKGVVILSDKLDKRVPARQVAVTQINTLSAPQTVAQKTNFVKTVAVMPSNQMVSSHPVATYGRANQYADLIERAAAAFQVESRFIHAIIHTESSYNPNAISPVGAQGLMQLMPATSRRFGVNNPYNPEQNIQGGVSYLRWLLNRYNGNLVLAAAAYNAGEGRVDQYGGIPPFKETQEYVQKVMRFYSNTGSAIAGTVIASNNMGGGVTPSAQSGFQPIATRRVISPIMPNNAVSNVARSIKVSSTGTFSNGFY